MIDTGVHFVDAIINLGGFPERAYASLISAGPRAEDEDGVVLTAALPGGAVAQIFDDPRHAYC